MTRTASLSIHTTGRGFFDVTPEVQKSVAESGVHTGLCSVFLHHTSASLILCENADDDVRLDLERFMSRLVPDGDPTHRHTAEGPDDMPSHIRSVLTANSIAIPVRDGRLDLGTWQSLYVWEHRHAPHRRRVSVTVVG